MALGLALGFLDYLNSPSPHVQLETRLYKDYYNSSTWISITDYVTDWGTLYGPSSVASTELVPASLTIRVANPDGYFSRANPSSFWSGTGGHKTAEPEECILRVRLLVYQEPDGLSGFAVVDYYGRIINIKEDDDDAFSSVEIETIHEPMYQFQKTYIGRKWGPVNSKYDIPTSTYTSLNTALGFAFQPNPLNVKTAPNLAGGTGQFQYYNGWDLDDFVNHYTYIEADSVNTTGEFYPCRFISRTAFDHTYGVTTDEDMYVEVPDNIRNDGGLNEYHFYTPLFYSGQYQSLCIRDMFATQVNVDNAFISGTPWDMETHQTVTRTWQPDIHALVREKNAFEALRDLLNYAVDGLFFMAGNTSKVNYVHWPKWADETSPYTLHFDSPDERGNLHELHVDTYTERLVTDLRIDYGSKLPTLANATWKLENENSGGETGAEYSGVKSSPTRERPTVLRRPWFSHYHTNGDKIAQQYHADYLHLYGTPIPRYEMRCALQAIEAEPADIIALDIPTRGINDKKLLVVQKDVDLQNLEVTLTCFDREFTLT